MSCRVLFDDIFNVVRFEGLFELSASHKEFDLEAGRCSVSTGSTKKSCYPFSPERDIHIPYVLL